MARAPAWLVARPDDLAGSIMRQIFNVWLLALMSFVIVSPLGVSAQNACPDGAVGCDRQNVDFSYTDMAFEEFSWTSGWVPEEPIASWADIKLRFTASLAGMTVIEMGGVAQTTWPDALQVAVPGRVAGGRLAIDYGPSLTAEYQATLDLGFAGSYSFMGDLPLPTDALTDLRLNSELPFQPFVLPGDMPRPVQLVETAGPIVITPASVGISVVTLSFSISATASVTVGYQTVDIEVRPSLSRIMMGGESVLLRPATELDGFGGFQDLTIVPHGTVAYDATIDLVASVTAETPIGDYTWPLGSYAVPITSETNETAFNEEMVHVTLPDIAVDAGNVGFGEVVLPGSASQTVSIQNRGEAELSVSATTSDDVFMAGSRDFTVAPGGSSTLDVNFVPSTAGVFNGMLTLNTNDPDTPTITVSISGSAMEPPPPADSGVPVVDAGVSDAGYMPPMSDGGCGCRVGAGAPSMPAGLAAVVLVVGLWFRRRRG